MTCLRSKSAACNASERRAPCNIRHGDGNLNPPVPFQTLFCRYSLQSSGRDDCNGYTFLDTLYFKISLFNINVSF